MYAHAMPQYDTAGRLLLTGGYWFGKILELLQSILLIISLVHIHLLHARSETTNYRIQNASTPSNLRQSGLLS
jgi:hypothetical protein